MPLYVVPANISVAGAGDGVTLSSGVDCYVPNGVSVISTGSDGIFGAFDGHDIVVDGSVTGFDLGISLGTDATLNRSFVQVGATGVVRATGPFGIGVYPLGGTARLENHGSVSGTSYGVVLDCGGTDGSSVLNYGTIAGNYAISRNSALGLEKLTVENFGTVIGGNLAFGSFNANALDVILNKGLMIGDISFDGGNDRYDGRGGRHDGIIYGDDGRDRMLLGNGGEHANGGNDADLLKGGTGRDTLEGGDAADRLTGGRGNDLFVFETTAHGKDVISDFSNTAGNNDAFEIDAGDFGGGLVIGTLAASQFRTRADNLAQDANDRFIFRTTDATLWFDINGNAAGGRFLLADLQAGAAVTAADILLV
jgi:Ca2+-binding RTX toxin-like protein